MAIRIDDDFMSLEVYGRVVVIARFSRHASADGHGARIVSCLPARLFARSQVITAMTVAELVSAGYAADDPLESTLREEPW
jgi:hypothetical protein